MRRLAIAQKYALALFEEAEKLKSLDKINNSLKKISEAILGKNEQIKIFDNPIIQKADKISLIKSNFNSYGETIINFLLILLEKKRLHILFEILYEYEDLIKKHNNTVDATVNSTFPIEENLIKKLKIQLEIFTGKNIILQTEIDNSLIGGITVRIKDTLIDGSIKNKLAQLKNILLNN
ncbi:MAG: F0F1 ATP synthase subunit delta [Candidatus Firestonebacteria bacterium]